MTSIKIILRLGALAMIVLATACAIKPTKQVIDIKVETAPVQLATPSPVVVIENVKDTRTFVSFNEDRSRPQLVTSGHDDAEITARTLGQFTTAGGDRHWDFLISGGSTVEDLVREALTRGFTLAGITVVKPGDRTDEAIPVSAEIIHFWSWNTGKWAFNFHFLSDVTIQGNIPPFETGETINGSIRLKSVIAGSSKSYINVVTKGLENFVQNLSSRIEAGK